MFYIISSVLAFSIVLGLSLSLFLVSPKEKIVGYDFFSQEKKDFFKAYLREELSYKEGKLSDSDWALRKKDFLNEYKGFL